MSHQKTLHRVMKNAHRMSRIDAASRFSRIDGQICALLLTGMSSTGNTSRTGWPQQSRNHGSAEFEIRLPSKKKVGPFGPAFASIAKNAQRPAAAAL
jgi:hypothetical protein